MAEILVVDDDETLCSAFRRFLQEEGHTPIIVSGAQDAFKAVENHGPDLVILDVRMPGIDGLEALQRIKQLAPNLHVVIMTAFGTSQTSIEAMRLGAFEYLTKPLDLDDLRSVVNKALADRALSRRASEGMPEDLERYALVNLVGNSPRMLEVYKIIGLLTTNDVPALLVGERGTGKQVSAKTVHFNSHRKLNPFVVVNCQGLTADSLENEIFGDHKGYSEHAGTGKLARADQGTLYLEEIHYLPLPAQARLLSYLADRSFQLPAGSGTPRPDIRLIAATTENLADQVRRGQFNIELYRALRVISIELPPLRHRKEDIPDLVQHFIRRDNADLHKSIKGIADGVIQFLNGHDWPGNVAELENLIKRACILARGEVITVDDLGNDFDESFMEDLTKIESELDAALRQALRQRLSGQGREGASAFHDIIGHVEAALVREALAITDGNQVRAAEILGLNRATLRKKMSSESQSD